MERRCARDDWHVHFPRGRLVEVETLTRALLDNGVRNILYSYYYIREMRREGFIARMQEEYPDVNWFLDSGAYTYWAKGQREGRALEHAEYVRHYFQYISDYGERYCRITELDLDVADVSVDQVEDWREEMLDRWPHLNITPVWHPWRGFDAWKEYVEDPRIKTLAMGGGMLQHGMIGKLRRYIEMARLKGKPVHGFGMTRIKTVLRHVPFSSVDSTSWVMGQKSGTTYIWKANRFIVLTADKKGLRRAYAKYFRNIGCDPRLVIADNVREVRKANVIAWRMLADRLEVMKELSGQTNGLRNEVSSVQEATRTVGDSPTRLVPGTRLGKLFGDF